MSQWVYNFRTMERFYVTSPPKSIDIGTHLRNIRSAIGIPKYHVALRSGSNSVMKEVYMEDQLVLNQNIKL